MEPHDELPACPRAGRCLSSVGGGLAGVKWLSEVRKRRSEVRRGRSEAGSPRLGDCPASPWQVPSLWRRERAMVRVEAPRSKETVLRRLGRWLINEGGRPG